MNAQRAVTSTIGSGSFYVIKPAYGTPLPSQARYAPTYSFSEKFANILENWENDTIFESNPVVIMRHPGFQAIVDNAKNILPQIISELRKKPSPLVWALEKSHPDIRPYDPQIKGDLKKVSAAWVTWAEKNVSAP